MNVIRQNTLASQRLYARLSTSTLCMNGTISLEPHLGMYAFRVRITDTLLVSVSYPPDAHGMIETALFNNDDDLIYDDALGYEDIQRFEDFDELVKELVRISSEVRKSSE